MKPYGVKIIDGPDVADIQAMGSKSCVGKVDSQHGYIRNPVEKARTRRYWKRRARRAGKAAIAAD